MRSVNLNGENLSCYSNTIESVRLRKCPHDYRLTNKAYLRAITVTNICKSFTYEMAAKISWHRHGTKLRYCHPVYTIVWSILAPYRDVIGMRVL